MKKNLLVLMMILFWIPCKSQDVNQESPNSKFTYCELVGTAKLLSNKVTVAIDFGQSRSFFTDTRYKDPATGKPYVFNSMVDALNFMGREGWEFVQAYTIGDAQTGYVYHFLLKKETKLLELEDQN